MTAVGRCREQAACATVTVGVRPPEPEDDEEAEEDPRMEVRLVSWQRCPLPED